MALPRAEIQRRYRERKKQKDGETFMKKERDRKRKYYVPVAELSKKELLKRRSQTLARVKKCIKKTKDQQKDSNDGPGPSTSTRTTPPERFLMLRFPFNGGKGTGVKKRYRTSLRNAYRKIEKLEIENTNLQKKNKRVQKRLERAKTGKIASQKGNLVNGTPNTPRSITRNQMKEAALDYDDKKHESVRKKLLFANAITAEIRQNVQSRKKNKLSSTVVISGKIIKKYRFNREFERRIGITRKTLRRSIQKSQNISERKGKTIQKRYGDLVAQFLQREDNCTVMPGKRDTKKVGKETHQKKILNDYVHNLFDKFRLENPNIKISRAAFYRLRPKQVMLVSFSSRSTCLCQRHQNMSLKLRALRNLGANVNINPDSFLASLNTDDGNMERISETLTVDTIEYTEWKKVQDNGKNRCKQVQMSMPKTKFIELFEKNVIEFREHVDRVKNQYAAMRTLRENLKEGEVLIWMDFAENFTCSSVEEVQSAYWNSEMVTLHTQVVYFPKDHGRSHISVVGVSSVLSHNAIAVTAMLRKLIPVVREVYPNLETVHYLTDSPTSQYRNKTIFNLICNHEQEFDGVRARWDYLEAGHGKGPCDGLGASVKRTADMAIKQSKTSIQSAADFYKWASTEAPNNSRVSYYYVSQEDYDTCEKAMSTSLIPVPGTMRAHAVVPVGVNCIAIREKSCNCQDCLIDVMSSNCGGWVIHRVRKDYQPMRVEENHDEGIEDIIAPHENLDSTVHAEVGQFIACVYEGQWYIGQVTDTDEEDNELKVKFMTRAGKVKNVYKWPQQDDELWVPNSAALMIINEPQPNGKTKRMFTVNGLEEAEILFQVWKARQDGNST